MDLLAFAQWCEETAVGLAIRESTWAFAVIESFGVAMMVLKQDRVLQLQYFSGATGTAKDLEAFRPVAKVAAAGL